MWHPPANRTCTTFGFTSAPADFDRIRETSFNVFPSARPGGTGVAMRTEFFRQVARDGSQRLRFGFSERGSEFDGASRAARQCRGVLNCRERSVNILLCI